MLLGSTFRDARGVRDDDVEEASCAFTQVAIRRVKKRVESDIMSRIPPEGTKESLRVTGEGGKV